MATKNRENEAGLIGAVLKDPSRIDEFENIVVSEDFDWQCYGWAWDAILSLRSQGMSIDPITVGDELDRKNKLSTFQLDEFPYQGRMALSFLRDMGEPRSIETYAENVHDYANKRRLNDIWRTAVDWTMNGRRSEAIILDITNKMSEIKTFSSSAFQHTQTLAQAVSDAYDYTDLAARGKINFVPTGYVDLDKMLGGGMSAPDLLIVAGRPGKGKTALLASIAKNAAICQKKVFIFSLEMQNKQIAMRLIAQESGVPYDRQKNGQLREDEWSKYTNAVEVLADSEKYPITLNDLPSISISKIRQELRRVKEVDLVIIDYIQLGGVDGKYERRDQEIGEITRGLKSIAKEFQVPILAAAQLSRAVEQRKEGRPVLSDLRESGDLEQDSDVVMFIHRPDDAIDNNSEIIVAKHRNGAVGSVELIYKPNLTRFENAVSRIFRVNELIEVEHDCG